MYINVHANRYITYIEVSKRRGGVHFSIEPNGFGILHFKKHLIYLSIYLYLYLRISISISISNTPQCIFCCSFEDWDKGPLAPFSWWRTKTPTKPTP